MSQFNRERRGDGQTTAIPRANLNSEFNPQPTRRPVPGAQPARTPQSILAKAEVDVTRHRQDISVTRDRSYNFLKGWKIVALGVLAIIGAASGAAWAEVNRFAMTDQLHYALMISVGLTLAMGPIYAYLLTTGLEKGVYSGIGKWLAWLLIILIVGNELLTMGASRDPVFAAWFMVKISPYILPALLLGAMMQLYFRDDLKQKRDMMHLEEREKKLHVKNASDTRMKAAQKQMQERNLGKVSDIVSQWRTGCYNVMINLVIGIVTDFQNALELSRIQREEQAKKIAKRRSPSKK